MIHDKEYDTQQFVDDLCGVQAQIYFNINGITWKNTPMTYQGAQGKLDYLNHRKSQDIYFIPNGGGTKNADITKINAVFIDWDAGKGPDGTYLPLDTVAKRKSEFLALLADFPLQASYVIETRNGFHVYWLLHAGTTKAQFSNTQKQFASHFGADASVHSPCHVMRVPGYYWYKKGKNGDPFYVYIHSRSDARYTIAELCAACAEVHNTNTSSEVGLRTASDGSDALSSNENSSNNNSAGRKSAHNNISRYYKDNTLDNYVGTYPQDTAEPAPNAVIDQIKRQDLAEYLDMEYEGEITPDRAITFKCLFHDDSKPSATIFVDKHGFYRYWCHAKECGFNGSIIDVVQEREQVSRGSAIEILKEHFQIEDDPGWRDRLREMLNENIGVIENLDECKEQFPYVHWAIGRIRRDLLTKLAYARATVGLRTYEGELIFVCSLRRFQELQNSYGKAGDLGRQNERIDRYCLLGLMRKLSDDEITPALRAGAYGVRNQMLKAQRKAGRKAKNMNRTQFYTIPAYTPTLLARANDIAQTLKAQGVRMNAISRDLVLQLFGEKKAAEVYPQVRRKGISPSGQELMSRIEKALLDDIKTAGYTTVSRVVDRMHRYTTWKSLTDRRVKKYLPWLLAKNGLVERTSNKVLKQKYDLPGLGYPKIIVPAVESAQQNRRGQGRGQ